MLQHYPAPTSTKAANNFSRTAVEPDNQDQFDTRVDRYFGARHRVFARYSYLRDEDVPVTPLPDGSGSLTSGVTGHAITRGDGAVAEYDWSPSPTMMNAARFGYTPARPEPDLAAKRRHHRTRSSGKFIRIRAAHFCRGGVSAGRPNFGCE